MIRPNDVEPIAKLAYLRFVKKANPNPAWDDLPESTRAVWRDRVFAADKMRRYEQLEDWADDCALAAIRKFEGGQQVPATVEPTPTKDKKVK